jgi:hypothetical protein
MCVNVLTVVATTIVGRWVAWWRVARRQWCTAATAAATRAAAQAPGACKLREACSSTCEACIVVKCNFAALVVFTDIWVVVTLIWAANESTSQGDLGWVCIAEVALIAAAASTNTCKLAVQQWQL